MDTSFQKFAGFSAILVGILSLVYAVLYLLVSRTAPALGINGSWIVLAVSGIFSSAVFVALYLHSREIKPGFALWGLLLGVTASMATLAHGIFEALLARTIAQSDPQSQAGLGLVQTAPSQVDPAGLLAFLVTGMAVFIFSYLISRSRTLPHPLGTLGMVNGLVLAILFFASALQVQTLILVAGGLTSVILGPIWWIWLGTQLSRKAV